MRTVGTAENGELTIAEECWYPEKGLYPRVVGRNFAGDGGNAVVDEEVGEDEDKKVACRGDERLN